MKTDKPMKSDVKYDNDDFVINEYDYDQQFYPYYNARLNQMKIELVRNANAAWPMVPIHELTDLADRSPNFDDDDGAESASQVSVEFHGKEVVILGTLFKKMSLQPNILKELDDEKKLEGDIQVDLPNFATENDIVFMQSSDESIELRGDIKIGELCTGICMAVKGHVNPNGSGFIVNDICFATPSEKAQTEIERPLSQTDRYVAIASGLGFSRSMSKNAPLTRSLNLLFDLLTGNSRLVIDKPIVHFIIAGNCLSTNARTDGMDCDGGRTPNWDRRAHSYTVDAVKLFDRFLANVGQYMQIDVMPGATDPCSLLWPQQPLHPALLPTAYRLGSIRSVTNPHRASYDGIEFVGTSGQNVDAIRSCTTYTDSVDIMRQLMEWSHLAPICPDLLNSYPFANENDPLTVRRYPDIFFVGNQNEFGLGTFESPAGKRVRLISIPLFEEKMVAILVNLRTLDCEMVAFD